MWRKVSRLSTNVKKINQVDKQEVGFVQMWGRLALYDTSIAEAAHKKSFDCHR